MFDGPAPSLATALPSRTQFWVTDTPETLDAVSMDGETAGGFELTISAQTAATGFPVTWVLRPNDLPNDLTTTGDVVINHGIGVIEQAAAGIAFQSTITCLVSRTGASRTFTVSTKRSDGTVFNSTCVWSDSTTPLQAFRFVAVVTANGLLSGTQLTAATAAGVATNISYRALGL